MTDKIEKMTDDDFKKIMQSLGMPDSMSLYAALKQVENHTWQAAQSVPVVERNQCDGCNRGLQVCDDGLHREPSGHPVMACTRNKYTRSTELATLREKAAMADELQKHAERMQKALSEIAEWTDRYTTPGHPVSTIARAAIAQGKGE